jgi:hypothetical protein
MDRSMNLKPHDVEDRMKVALLRALASSPKHHRANKVKPKESQSK